MAGSAVDLVPVAVRPRPLRRRRRRRGFGVSVGLVGVVGGGGLVVESLLFGCGLLF